MNHAQRQTQQIEVLSRRSEDNILSEIGSVRIYLEERITLHLNRLNW